jgi:hypothetical protein
MPKQKYNVRVTLHTYYEWEGYANDKDDAKEEARSMGCGEQVLQMMENTQEIDTEVIQVKKGRNKK